MMRGNRFDADYIIFSSLPLFPLFLSPLLPCILPFLTSFFASFFSFHPFFFLSPPYSNWRVTWPSQCHQIQLIRLFTAQVLWPRWKFEPEIPPMHHLPNKLGLHLPSRVSFPNYQKNSLRLVATMPSFLVLNRAVQVLPLRNKSAPTHRSVNPQNQHIQVLWNNYYLCLPL